jgi:hypothetical protein
MALTRSVRAVTSTTVADEKTEFAHSGAAICCALIEGSARTKKVRFQETAYSGPFPHLFRRGKRKTERKLASKIASKKGHVSLPPRDFFQRAIADLNPKDRGSPLPQKKDRRVESKSLAVIT